jgi:hypothetical protein
MELLEESIMESCIYWVSCKEKRTRQHVKMHTLLTTPYQDVGGTPGVVGLASPLLFLLSRLFSLGKAATLPLRLCASVGAGVAAPLGVGATEGATLGGRVSSVGAGGWDDGWAVCSWALFRSSTAFLVLVKTNAPGSPLSGFSSMYSSPYLLVNMSDCMNSASEKSVVASTASVGCDAATTCCDWSRLVGASVGLPTRLAVGAALAASYEGGKYEWPLAGLQCVMF